MISSPQEYFSELFIKTGRNLELGHTKTKS